MASNDILVKVGADVSDYSRKMKESTQELKKFGDSNKETFDAFKKTGAVVSAAGATLTAGLGFAVSKAKDFEAGMSKVAAISGSTGEDLESLTDIAREMGSETSFSATEAAEGLEYMALAGWNTEQMIGGLEPVLHLAEAGALDLGRTSDLVTDSMAGLGLEVDELSGYLDKVAHTAANSNTDIDALMEAMVIAGGTFERLNVPLEESTAFLGVLANRGFKASQAGTAVNAIMTRLTSGTGEAADALDEMGISAFDSEGNFKGMEAVMRELEGALSGMDEETRAHYQTMLAGLNHGKTFNAMLNGLTDEYDELKSGVSESDGALKEMRDTMKDNLQGALENLGSAFEEILRSLGTALLPVVKTLVGWLQKAADWFNNLSDGTKTTIAVLLGIAAAVAAIAGPMLLLVGFIPQIVAGFAALKVAVLATTGVIGKATTALLAKAAASKVLGTALKVMTGPIGWVVAGVGLLTAATVGIVKWFKRESEEAKKLNSETEELAGETEKLADAAAASAEAYKEKQSETLAEIKNNEELARKVQELSDKENKSAAEKEMLKSYTDKLNESMEGLNLTYDEESGKLNQSSEMIQARIDLMGEQEKANDAMERAKEITEEQVKVEKKLEETNKLREESNHLYEEGAISKREHKKAVEELDAQENELNDTLGILSEQYESTEKQVEKSMDAIAKASEVATEKQKLTYEELEDAQKDLVDEMKTKWGEIADASTDMFNKISDEAEVSFEEMQEIFDHNVEATANWAENLEKLADAGVSSSFLDTFRKRGPESAAEVQALVDANIDEVKKLGDGYEEQVKLSLDQMAQAYNLDTTQFEAVKHLVENVGLTFEEAIKQAGFDSYGEDIAEGAAKGIKDRAIVAATSVSDMVSDMRDVFTKENEIKSPSRLYKRLAENIPLGTKQGIDGKSSGAVSAVKNMANKMTSSMRGIKSTFSTIGSESIAGLSRGLDANKGSLFSKASSIASNIAGRMRSALKIASPSRVMADIGRWIPEGLAAGIDGNSNKVYNAVQSMTSGIQAQDLSLDYATPGGVKSSLAGAVSGTVDVNSGDGKLSASIDELRRDLTNLRIVMDGDKVGELVGPRINERNAVDSEIGRYFD